jgi:hypothetical protein
MKMKKQGRVILSIVAGAVTAAACIGAPVRIARVIFWLPSKAYDVIDSVFIRDRGTHGLGHYHPVLLFATVWIASIGWGAVVAWVVYKLTGSGKSLTPTKNTAV